MSEFYEIAQSFFVGMVILTGIALIVVAIGVVIVTNEDDPRAQRYLAQAIQIAAVIFFAIILGAMYREAER